MTSAVPFLAMEPLLVQSTFAPLAAVAAVMLVAPLTPLPPLAPFAYLVQEEQSSQDFQTYLDQIIGEPQDIYFNSQEMFGGEGHSSGEELSNHSSDEEDYYDGDGMVSLEEDPPWVLELLYYPPTHAPRPKRHRHGRERRGGQTQVGGTNEDDNRDFVANDVRLWEWMELGPVHRGELWRQGSWARVRVKARVLCIWIGASSVWLQTGKGPAG